MPINYPGPFEIRINYLTDEALANAAHQLRLSCVMSVTGNPGDPFSSWIPIQKNGSAVSNLATHVDNLMTVLRPLYKTAVSFTDAELWEYNPGTFDAVYRSSYALALAGTSASSTITASQSILTFRTALGGIMKVDMRGTVFSPSITDAAPFTAGSYATLAAIFTAATDVWVGRDGGYPLAALAFLPGQNEHAWKVANRP